MAIIKTKEEITKLRNAAILGANCFDYIINKIKVGMTEIEIAKKIDDFFIKHGASGLSFETIVGSGKNSSQIHSTPTNRAICENDIILFDMGCVLNGYCSDMSRTVFVGKPTAKQLKTYNLVYEAYLNAVNNIRVGTKANDADMMARKIIIDKGLNFNHALGHGVGTKVHEIPVLSPKKERRLKSNMVFSIEPGIYYENNFGVRIEDVGVLTPDGMDMFTSPYEEVIII